MFRKLLAPCLFAAVIGVAHAQETIPVGGLLETSGPVASLGQPGLEGAQLAIDQVNAKGGVAGKKLDLININTEGDNTKTVTAVKRLLGQNVVGFVGPMNSGSSFAIIDTVQRAKVPLISNGGSRNIVLPAAEKPWIFLAPLTDVLVQSVMMTDMKQHGITSIALLNADSPFGTSGREQLEKYAGDYGIKIVDEQAFGNADQDMTPQVSKIRDSQAQAVVVWATGPGQAIAVKNYRQLGVNRPLYLSHAANDFNFLRLAGASAEGVLIPSSKLYIAADLKQDDPQKPVIEKFLTDYTAKYGHPPSTFAGNGYDSAMMLATAIGNAGTDPQKIRDTIEGLKDYVGVTAIYSYGPTDHFGAKPDSVVMLSVANGKFTLKP